VGAGTYEAAGRTISYPWHRKETAMALDIERKFLVCGDEWRGNVHQLVSIRQGYFCRTPHVCGRVRIFGDKGFVTLKSEPGTLVRHEYEYDIPMADAAEIMEHFSIEPVIVKQRHLLYHEDILWSVDVFEDANEGLIVAEVELSHAEQLVIVPPWAGPEVTADPRYSNSNLAQSPCSTWE
jgi:adenylate cyclase